MSDNTGNAVRHRRDWPGAVASVFFCLVGAYIITASFSMTKMAAVFPRTIGVVMVVLSLMQIAAALTGRSGQSLESSGSDFAEGRGRRIVLVVTMVGWALLFPVLGMFVTSFAACFILMATGQFGRPTGRQLTVYLVSVLAMVSFFYLLMTRVLNIPMPRGLFF
jgi:putative tricarboxylic transport membrane protein